MGTTEYSQKVFGRVTGSQKSYLPNIHESSRKRSKAYVNAGSYNRSTSRQFNNPRTSIDSPLTSTRHSSPLIDRRKGATDLSIAHKNFTPQLWQAFVRPAPASSAIKAH